VKQTATQNDMSGNVLVIDDDANIIDLIGYSLRPLGLSVVGATTGPDGLDIFEDLAPDLVALDVLMPEMNGWEVCKRLRERSDVPILFVSVLDGERNVVQGLQAGADDYMAKPFDVDELRARVIALLRRTHLAGVEPDEDLLGPMM
jgi:DNA-binding response OmpR family regulator